MSGTVQIQKQASDETIRSFNLMWDSFPHVVLLLNQSRTIQAVNRMGRDLGIIPETKCYELTQANGVHPVCKADAALKDGQSRRSTGANNGRVLDSYWLPLEGDEGLYIHFAIDITKYAKEELLENQSNEG